MSTPSEYLLYTASAGDTWDSIAFAMYTEEREASTLIEANPGMAHVVTFEGGETVIVPLIEEAESSEDLPPWRQYGTDL